VFRNILFGKWQFLDTLCRKSDRLCGQWLKYPFNNFALLIHRCFLLERFAAIIQLSVVEFARALPLSDPGTKRGCAPARLRVFVVWKL
jgi:hypothetical protein